jgi:hypothetical protein
MRFLAAAAFEAVIVLFAGRGMVQVGIALGLNFAEYVVHCVE